MNLEQLRNILRQGQQPLADWHGGSMAVSAVPGAGKSTGMAVAAAITIARYNLNARHQLVVVTFTRSAAASIKSKIREYLQKLRLPQGGFVVHTLHGLALNIASHHPELSGLNLNTGTVMIPTPSHPIIRACVEKWIARNLNRYKVLLEGVQFDGEETEQLRRQSVLRTEVLPQLAYIIIQEAKSSGLTPQEVYQLSQQTQETYDILGVGAGLYEQYQKIMRSRDFIDYDDMILACLQVLEQPAVRKLWQQQVFAVFEDEAQDSSPLQEKLLKILATDPQNPHTAPHLVRVGDPNQAINSTFTPADPVYFNWFCDTCREQDQLTTMDQAGRSNPKIIQAANFLIHWFNQEGIREHRSRSPEALGYPSPTTFRLQDIRPVDADDPQPDANPPAIGQGLELYTPDDIYHSVELIGERIVELLTQNPDHSAAILVRENRQGSFLAQQFQKMKLQDKIDRIYDGQNNSDPEEDNEPRKRKRVYEVGEVARHSQIPREILKLLEFLDRPHSPDNLKAALKVLQERKQIATQDLDALAIRPEQFLYPTPLDPPQKKLVKTARQYCCNLLKARLELPHYQLISFLAMALKYTGSELATVHKLAERMTKETLGKSSLPNTLETLREIVSSERFEGVEETSDNEYTRPGQLTIITMHKAKGLDWDYVFIPFLHEKTLPGQLRVPTGGKFLGDFTLAEVARAQIREVVHYRHLQRDDSSLDLPQPQEAWEKAAELKKAEEYRLLYVAMTRAKRLLWMAAEKQGPFRWNILSGQSVTNLQSKQPCSVFSALQRQFRKSVIDLSF